MFDQVFWSTLHNIDIQLLAQPLHHYKSHTCRIPCSTSIELDKNYIIRNCKSQVLEKITDYIIQNGKHTLEYCSYIEVVDQLEQDKTGKIYLTVWHRKASVERLD